MELGVAQPAFAGVPSRLLLTCSWKEMRNWATPGAQEHTALLNTYGLHSPAQLEFLVCIPQDNQLQKGPAELEACGEREEVWPPG